MKRFIYACVLALIGLVGFCGFAAAADKNIEIREYSVDTLGTQCIDVVFFNAYIENTIGEIFSGSSTTSGGTTTSSNGAINVAGWTNPKYFGLTLAAEGTGGSVTVSLYGIAGTTTVAVGTANAFLLQDIKSYSLLTGGNTSTVFAIPTNPTMMLCGVNVTAGSIKTTLGMHSNQVK